MSVRNGDRARFHRDRRKKIARRKRNHEMLKRLGEQGKMAAASPGPKPQTVVA